MKNSEKIKEAIDKASEEIDKMSDDDFYDLLFQHQNDPRALAIYYAWNYNLKDEEE